MRRLLSLNTLKLGRRARIKAVGEGPLYRRLLDMGLVPETVVQAVRQAPFGDPVAYLVRGYYLALRREEAATILVEEIALNGGGDGACGGRRCPDRGEKGTGNRGHLYSSPGWQPQRRQKYAF
uniref:Ferrous iron transport protein A n=1 Tax=Ammonifex degensii TaxID=42838 RepID=A0A7C2E324_9THEO